MKFNTQEKKNRTSNSNMIKITFIFFVNSLSSHLHSTSAKILNDLDSRTKNQCIKVPSVINFSLSIYYIHTFIYSTLHISISYIV